MPDAPSASPAELYDPASHAIQDDPFPSYRTLLATHPVYRNETRDFWALSRYADVQAGFRDWRRLSSAGGVTIDELLELMGPQFLTMDPPRHDALREIVRDAFRPKEIAALEGRIAEHVRRLVAGLPDDGEVDIVEAFAHQLPVLVVCELLGLPTEDEPLLRGHSDALLARDDADVRTPEAGREAARAMRAYFEEQLADRLRSRRDDLVSLVAHARVDGTPVPHEEQVGMCFLLFEAGNTTTKALIANAIVALAGERDERDRLRRDPSRLPRAIEEVLRLESPVQNMGRIAAEEIELHGTTIPAGARVLLLIGAANRDPRTWGPDADRLVVDRPQQRHLAFGEGIHHCVGAPLARLEAKVALHELLAHFPDYELVEVERLHDVTLRNARRLVIDLGGRAA